VVEDFELGRLEKKVEQQCWPMLKLLPSVALGGSGREGKNEKEIRNHLHPVKKKAYTQVRQAELCKFRSDCWPFGDWNCKHKSPRRGADREKVPGDRRLFAPDGRCVLVNFSGFTAEKERRGEGNLQRLIKLPSGAGTHERVKGGHPGAKTKGHSTSGKAELRRGSQHLVLSNS